MHTIQHNAVRVDSTPLESILPPGLVSGESAGAAEAFDALRTVQKLIEEMCAENAVLSRYAWLRSFPRLTGNDGGIAPDSGALERLCRGLCPSLYGDLFESFSRDEMEVFLKNFLTAHERWGHPAGIGALVKSMLESVLHRDVPVAVTTLRAEEREIPEPLQSTLGRRLSVIGQDFIPGRRFLCRPRNYEILVGPVSRPALSVLERAGWARATVPAPRLERLLEYAEAFYLKGRIRFVLEKDGWILGEAVLADARLGDAGTGAFAKAAGDGR